MKSTLRAERPGAFFLVRVLDDCQNPAFSRPPNPIRTQLAGRHGGRFDGGRSSSRHRFTPVDNSSSKNLEAVGAPSLGTETLTRLPAERAAPLKERMRGSTACSLLWEAVRGSTTHRSKAWRSSDVPTSSRTRPRFFETVTPLSNGQSAARIYSVGFMTPLTGAFLEVFFRRQRPIADLQKHLPCNGPEGVQDRAVTSTALALSTGLSKKYRQICRQIAPSQVAEPYCSPLTNN